MIGRVLALSTFGLIVIACLPKTVEKKAAGVARISSMLGDHQ